MEGLEREEKKCVCGKVAKSFFYALLKIVEIKFEGLNPYEGIEVEEE